MSKSGPRMLKGLSLDNLVEEEAEESIEQDGANEAADKKPVGRRSLRQRNDDAIYDMKYHPMDVVTRPNRAATIRYRSKSVSLAMDDYDDDESSGVSSSSSSDEPDDEESDDEEKVNAVRPRVVLTPRTPHSRAVRHSARSEAHKQINYSTKSHPQDYALPGFKHRAPLHVLHPQVLVHSSSPPKKAKRKHMLPTPEDDGQIDLLSAYDDAQEEEEPEQLRPRKKLRSINPNISSSPRPNTPAKCGRDKPLEVADSEDEVEYNGHVDDLVEMASRASQPPPRQPQASSDANIEDTFAMSMNDSQQQPPPQTRTSQSDEIPSVIAGDEDNEEGGEVPQIQQPEADTSTIKGQAEDDRITGQQSSGSLLPNQHVDADNDADEKEQQVEHDASTKDQPARHSESSQQPDHIDGASRQQDHNTQIYDQFPSNFDVGQKGDNIDNNDMQPGHHTPVGSQSTSDTDSSQKRGDTSGTDHPLRHVSPMGDQDGDGSSPSQSVDETDQQQYHDALTGNELTDQDDSLQQPDNGLEEVTNLQPQTESNDDTVAHQDLAVEVFPGSLPPRSHQPQHGHMTEQEDGLDYDPEDDEDHRQPSDFDEQIRITEPRYKGQDSDVSLDPLLSSDPTHLLP